MLREKHLPAASKPNQELTNLDSPKLTFPHNMAATHINPTRE
jgi:hypothetical protein